MVDGNLVASGENLQSSALFNEIFPVNIVRSSTSVDLSGGAETLVVLHSERACTLKKATLVYTEASTADAGVGLEIGKESDRNYFYTGTSEISKLIWYTLDVTLLQTDLDAGDTVTFYSAGGKANAGEVMLVLEYYYTV